MEPSFPPQAPPSEAAVLFHLMLLALVVGSIAGLFVTGRRPARPADVFLWLTTIIVATVMCVIGAAENSLYRPFLLGYMLLVWAVGGVGCLLSAVRLMRQGKGPAIFWVLASLIGLGLLIGLSLPAVPSAREAARRMSCSNNLKQIALAMSNWHDEHGRFPDAETSQADGAPQSWRVALLPLLERSALHAQYDPTRAWDDPSNLPVANTPATPYQCPSNPHVRDDHGRYFTAYTLVTGPGTIFPGGKGISANAVADGMSNTLLVAEACGKNIVWTEPEDVDVRLDPISLNLGGDRPHHSPSILSSYHSDGALAAFADGSVRFMHEGMDAEVLRALTTAAGGETPENR